MNSSLDRIEKRIYKLEGCAKKLVQNIGQKNRYKNEPFLSKA